MSAPARPAFWPVLRRPQRSVKAPSSGARAIETRPVDLGEDHVRVGLQRRQRLLLRLARGGRDELGPLEAERADVLDAGVLAQLGAVGSGAPAGR